jgi:hypothetical protein
VVTDYKVDLFFLINIQNPYGILIICWCSEQCCLLYVFSQFITCITLNFSWQARDSYYSGQPLIVDDMFDKVEVNSTSLYPSLHTPATVQFPNELCFLPCQLKLRVYGSPSVVKYPRCSLKRQSAYADAEVTLFGILPSVSHKLNPFSFRHTDSRFGVLIGIWV